MAQPAVSKFSQKKLKTLNIVFVTPKRSRELNKEFRKKNKPTDVLSFNSFSVPDKGSSVSKMQEGELVLCIEVLRKQASEAGHSFKAELGLMILHGYLHLLGFDH